MADSMIERVARAMWLKKEALTAPPRVSWENAEPKDRDFMLAVARAAIEAMREPSEAVTLAGEVAIETAGSFHTNDIWKAMIDAALSEDGAASDQPRSGT